MIRHLFLDRPLKTRITFLYTLFAVVLVGGITFYTYHFTADLLQSKETSILNDSLEYLENRISVRLKAVNEEYINIFDDNEFLKLYLDSLGGGRGLTEQMEINEAYRNYFLDMRVRNSDLIKSIQLVTSDGNVYSDEYRPVLDYEQFAESVYYRVCMADKNKIMYRNLEEASDYFCILRSFYFTGAENGDAAYPGVGYLSEKDEDYSILMFLLKKEYLRNIIREEAKKRQTSIFILDQEGEIIVQEGSLDWLSREDAEILMEEVRERAEENFDGRLERGRAGIHMKPVDLFDWYIIFVYDRNIIYQQAGQIRNVALVVFLFSVLAIFLIAGFISTTVVRPIQALEKSMEVAVENNMEVSFRPRYNDEVASLGRKFAVLMSKVSNLMAEVKQAEEQKRVEELKALQAQINPHFLYNTLDMVYWLAKMDGNDNIANLIADLADFFRLSLNKGEDITTVEREAAHVAKYLEIQRVRMDGKFDYSIETDNAVRDCRIPKLILQPFAENALVHGFEGIDYQGRIEITIAGEGERIVFTVADNGRGIGEKALEAVRLGKGAAGNRKGYAVGNVRDRIRLYAGADYGVEFDTVEIGTRVRITFPFDYNKADSSV